MLGGFQERQRSSRSRVSHVRGGHVFGIGLEVVFSGSRISKLPGAASPSALVALELGQCPGTVSLGSLPGSGRAAVTLPSAISLVKSLCLSESSLPLLVTAKRGTALGSGVVVSA